MNDDIVAEGLSPRSLGFPVALYRPRNINGRAPAVVFLPGRFSPEDQYESYARLLASHGFVVLVRGLYAWNHRDVDLMWESVAMGDYLRARRDVDGERIAIAGHSMGGRNAIWAAMKDPRFRAVVSIDPGGETSPPIINGVTGRLRAPLLLIGAQMGWRGVSFCSPVDTNYQRFFERSAPGTVELTLMGADHVQLMDEPDRFGMQLCRGGFADSQMVRILSRRATYEFIAEHTNHGPHATFAYGRQLARVRVRPGAVTPGGEAPPAPATNVAGSAPPPPAVASQDPTHVGTH